MQRELTVCLFSREKPDLKSFSRRFGAVHQSTLHEFDGRNVPMTGGEEQYLWQPYGLDVNVHSTLHPGYCNAIVPFNEAVALGFPKQFVHGCPELYEMLQDVPDIRLVIPSYPWEVLQFTRGEQVYGTYFSTTLDDEDFMFQTPVQEMGKVSGYLARRHDGLVWANKRRTNANVRAWLKEGSKQHVLDLVREAK